MSKKSRRKRHVESMTDNLFRGYDADRTYHFTDMPYYSECDFGKNSRETLEERLIYDDFTNKFSLPKDLYSLWYGFRF